MSVYCPILDHKVTYIHCQDCDKECKKTEELDRVTFACMIVGSRGFDDYELMKKKMDQILANANENILIVSGGARGADTLAEKYAKERGYKLKVFPCTSEEWKMYGNKAGYMRNERMHKFISGFANRGCVAFWDGSSKGTKQNFKLAEDYKTQLRIIKY